MSDRNRLEKKTSIGSNEIYEFCLSCMQGMRHEMEDEHCLELKMGNLKKWAFFAVFDGHGGTLCAHKSSERLVHHIMNCILETARIDNVKFEQIDQLTERDEKALNHLNPNEISVAIKRGFLQMDEELKDLEPIKNDEDSSGTTLIFTLIKTK